MDLATGAQSNLTYRDRGRTRSLLVGASIMHGNPLFLLPAARHAGKSQTPPSASLEALNRSIKDTGLRLFSTSSRYGSMTVAGKQPHPARTRRNMRPKFPS